MLPPPVSVTDHVQAAFVDPVTVHVKAIVPLGATATTFGWMATAIPFAVEPSGAPVEPSWAPVEPSLRTIELSWAPFEAAEPHPIDAALDRSRAVGNMILRTINAQASGVTTRTVCGCRDVKLRGRIEVVEDGKP
jgi:hypothetical protein